jgi:hypothetical protein
MQIHHVVALMNTSLPDVTVLERDDYFTTYHSADLLDHLDALLDAWLAMPSFTCCRMQTGYIITIDADSPRYDVTDHFWHMGGWFYALNQVLASENAEVKTFVWDESSLNMTRYGDMLTMFDGFPEHRPYFFEPATFPLHPFVDQMVREGQTSVRLMNDLIERLLARGYDAAELLAHVKPLGDKPNPADDDLDLKAAIIYRELYQPVYFDQVAQAAKLLAAR